MREEGDVGNGRFRPHHLQSKQIALNFLQNPYFNLPNHFHLLQRHLQAH